VFRGAGRPLGSPSGSAQPRAGGRNDLVVFQTIFFFPSYTWQPWCASLAARKCSGAPTTFCRVRFLRRDTQIAASPYNANPVRVIWRGHGRFQIGFGPAVVGPHRRPRGVPGDGGRGHPWLPTSPSRTGVRACRCSTGTASPGQTALSRRVGTHGGLTEPAVAGGTRTI
jgi:hypothetical protein